MLDILNYRVELLRLALVILAVAAWRRGAGPERACAAALALFLVQDPIDWILGDRFDYTSVALRDFLLDGAVGALLLAIALRANRVYPLLMAAWQGLAVLSHLGRIGSSSSAALAYSIMMYVPAYLLAITLGAGLFAHVRRERRWGRCRSWWNDRPPWRPARPAVLG